MPAHRVLSERAGAVLGQIFELGRLSKRSHDVVPLPWDLQLCLQLWSYRSKLHPFQIVTHRVHSSLRNPKRHPRHPNHSFGNDTTPTQLSLVNPWPRLLSLLAADGVRIAPSLCILVLSDAIDTNIHYLDHVPILCALVGTLQVNASLAIIDR